MERLGLEFPVLQDMDARVTKDYGVFNLLRDGLAAPATLLLDGDGAIQWQYIGKYKSDRPSNGQIIGRLEGF